MDNRFWTVVFIAFVLGLAMLGSPNNKTQTAPATTNRDSFEHKYATERFKQEGFSAADAQQAADAVIKFHNAQKNR